MKKMLPLRVIRLCWKSIINVKIITIILQVVWRIEPSVFPHIGQVTNVNTVKLVSSTAGRQPQREAQLTGELCRSHTSRKRKRETGDIDIPIVV